MIHEIRTYRFRKNALITELFKDPRIITIEIKMKGVYSNLPLTDFYEILCVQSLLGTKKESANNNIELPFVF